MSANSTKNDDNDNAIEEFKLNVIGGGHRPPIKDLNVFLTSLYNKVLNKKYDESLTFNIQNINTFPYYVDIDGCSHLNIIKKTINDVLSEYYCEAINTEYYQFTNESKPNNHHLYYPYIIMDRQTAYNITLIINSRLESDNKLDTLSNYKKHIKFDMFNKANKKGKIIKKTRYKPVNCEYNLKLLKDIYNFNKTKTKLIKLLPKQIKKPTFTERADNIEEINNKSRKSILEFYKPNITRKPKHISYGVIQQLNNGVKCLFVDRAHSKSDSYLIINDYQIIFGCYSPKCCNKLKSIYKSVELSGKQFNQKQFTQIKSYKDKVKYFEKYYFYVMDDDVLFRRDTRYNTEYKYWEQNLKIVKSRGLRKHKYLPEKTDDEEDDPKPRVFIDDYLTDEYNSNMYLDTAFNPDLTYKSPGLYNVFNGFNFSKILDEDIIITPEDYKELDWFMNEYLFEYFCSSNKQYFNYFINLLANLIQEPTNLAQIMVIYYSETRGVGKTTFNNFICRIVGMEYCYIAEFDRIKSRFSTAFDNRLLIFMDEFYLKSGKEESQLRNIITQRQATIEKKGIQEKTAYCFPHLFAATNPQENGKITLHITEEMRRFFILNITKITGKDAKQVLNRLNNFYDNPKMVFLFGDYLANYKIKYKRVDDWRDNRPITDINKKLLNTNNVHNFLEAIYKNELNNEWYYNGQSKGKNKYLIKYVKDSKIYNFYKNYCETKGLKPFGEPRFKKILDSLNIKIKSHSNRKLYKLDLKKIHDKINIVEKFVEYHNPDYCEEISDSESDGETEIIEDSDYVESENEDVIILDNDELDDKVNKQGQDAINKYFKKSNI